MANERVFSIDASTEKNTLIGRKQALPHLVWLLACATQVSEKSNTRIV
jgi:hypothetical protein